MKRKRITVFEATAAAAQTAAAAVVARQTPAGDPEPIVITVDSVRAAAAEVRQIPAGDPVAITAAARKAPAAEKPPRRLPVWLGPVIVILVLVVVWLPRVVNDAAATVNGENISRGELEKRVAFERLWNQWNGQPDPASGSSADRFRAQVLDAMVENRLALQAAKKAAITVSSQEIALQVANVGSQLQLSEAQINDSLSRAGLARQTLDDIMREDVLADKFMRLVVANGTPQAEQQTAILNWYNTALARASIEKHIQSGTAQIGEPAPDFALNRLDGTSVRLSDFKGKAVFVNFFATWCTACRAEMPDVEATWRAHKDESFVLLTVNLTSQDAVSDVTKFVQEFSLTMPVLLDETGTVASLYKVVPVPASYFIDKNGVLRAVQVGGMSRQTMEKRVAKVLQ